MKLILCLSSVFFAFQLSVAKGQTYAVFGAGNVSCGTWIADRQASQAYNEQAWVLGFVSGQDAIVMFTTKQTVDINTDANGIFGWLDNYCRVHPTDTLAAAAEAFWATSNTVSFKKD